MENLIGQTRKVTRDDVDRGGTVVQYERRVTNEIEQALATLYSYPIILSMRGTIDSTRGGKHNWSEEFEMHWVAADSLTFSEVLIQQDTVLASKTFLPQAGDVFSINFGYECKPYYTITYTVIGFDYEDASKDVIKLEAMPLSMHSCEDMPF